MTAIPQGARLLRVSVLLLALLCLATGALVGWRVRGEPERAPSYLAQLADALDLRPDQLAALESVLAEEDREIDALLDEGLRRLREPVTARRLRTEEQLLALLDTTQRARYEQLLRTTDAAGEGADGRGR
jgi:hypothetical protein